MQRTLQNIVYVDLLAGETSKSIECIQTPSSANEEYSFAFKPKKIRVELRKETSLRITEEAGACLAGVLDYISAELVECSGEVSQNLKKTRIMPKHIVSALKNDAELKKMFSNIVAKDV